MNLNLSGHHLEITPAIRSYVISKLERIERHFDRVTDINVVLSVEKLQQKIEAVVHMRGKDLFVEATHDDLYAAIDNLTDKLDRQIIKHKEKAAGGRSASTPLKRSAIDLDQPQQ